MAQLDENKLHEFVGKMLGDLGGAFSVPSVRIGLRLGLFDALHEGGSATSAELAKRAGLFAVGDEGWLVVGEKIDEPPGFATRSRRVRVVGVARTGLFEYDSTWVYLALANETEIAGAAMNRTTGAAARNAIDLSVTTATPANESGRPSPCARIAPATTARIRRPITSSITAAPSMMLASRV